MQIDNFEPRKVFHYFSEISKIPHCSGNTEKIAQYCLDFARDHGLFAYRDDSGNVMIFKNAAPGYEKSEPVILQGHLDMVCEKIADSPYDMQKDPVNIIIDGDYLRADGTTLGGDDGIAVAYILAILSSDDIAHPPIEALLTTDEEVGLRGANNLDASHLKGKKLINIDSEEEGKLTVSCAGAVRADCAIPIDLTKIDGLSAKKVTLGGLLGGHSGIDIDKCRKNAVKTLAHLLYDLNRSVGINIADISSGGRLNVIPSRAEALICFKSSDKARVEEITAAFDKELKKDSLATEPDAFVMCEDAAAPCDAADDESTKRIVFALLNTFDGVYGMSPTVKGLVQTSSNMGSVLVEGDTLKIGLMIRSNTAAGKRAVVKTLKSLYEYLGGSVNLLDDYPAWEYRNDSPLRDTMVMAYREMYGELPEICAIHAGLECGILSGKLGGADMVSIGPDMENVHTVDERLSIKSTRRVWQYLLKVLEMLK